ncbi:MAG TPA: hypothetical protein VE618_11550, partial [Myxococcaceae bacterium]|nr:hypothetical protein [Myxococcaceae bacterium]
MNKAILALMIAALTSCAIRMGPPPPQETGTHRSPLPSAPPPPPPVAQAPRPQQVVRAKEIRA